MRLKDRRRIILAAAALVVVAGAASSLLVVRKWQRSAITSRYLQQGLAAHQKGDYFHALNDTSQFIKRTKKEDPRRADALLAYADSRANITEADGRHLREAVAIYQQYLERRPDDAKTRLALLKLYTQSGYFAEAKELAAKLLPQDLAKATAEDVPVLREEAKALLFSKDFATRRTQGNAPTIDKVLARLLELAPLDLEGNIAKIEFLNQTKGDLPAMAAQVLAGHENDPAAKLIAALATMQAPGRADAQRRQEIWKLLAQSAGLDPATGKRAAPAPYTDQAIGLQIVGAMEAMGRADEALAVLEDGADRLKAPELTARLVRRLWQDGQDAAVVERTAGLDPAAMTSDPDILGLRGLSLQNLGRKGEVESLVKILEKREGDYRATNWAKAIPLADRSRGLKPAELVSGFQAIAKATAGREPVVMYFLGDALAAMGKTDDARQAWAQAAASPVSKSWVAPWLRMTETLIGDGRYDEAAGAAEAGRMIAPTRVMPNVLAIEAASALIQNGNADLALARQALQLLTKVEEGLHQAGDAGGSPALLERLLPTKVLLLSKTGATEDAKKAALAALDGPAKLKPETLQRLATVSVQEQLGFESRCIEAAKGIDGAGAGFAWTRALASATEGKVQEGLDVLKKAAADKPSDADVALAVAQYMERAGMADAPAAWVKVGDQFPADLKVQRAILSSFAAAGDRGLIEKTIDRYQAALGVRDGAEDNLTRMAQARAILRSKPSKSDYDRAVALLQAVVTSQPSNVEPKLLLASALVFSDPSRGINPDLPRAVGLLTDASVLQPSSAPIALDLARVLQQQRDFGKAREILVRIAASDTLNSDLREAAASLLIQQGEQNDPGSVAVATLKKLTDQQGDRAKPSLLVTLAEVLIAKGGQADTAAGNAIYDRLLGGLANDQNSLYLVARHYTLMGEAGKAKAEQALAKLDALRPSAAFKEFCLARLDAETGNSDGAAKHYEAAVKAASGDEAAAMWREYASMYIRAGKFNEAADVCQRGLEITKGDPTLAGLLAQARPLAGGDADDDLAELVRALTLSPRGAGSPDEMTRAVRDSKARGEFGAIDALARLADRFRSSGQFQLFIARRMVPLDSGRADALADRATAASPDDPSVARFAAQVYLATGNYKAMLAAARNWRGLDASNSPEADVAIAEACLGLKQFAEGIGALKDRLPVALRAPDDPFSDGVLNTQGRLLIRSGKPDEASSLLRPLLTGSRTARMVWITLAASELADLSTAKKWIDEVQGLMPSDAVPERLAAATAYAVLADRDAFKAQQGDLLAASLAALSRLSEDPTALKSPQAGLVFETLGKIRQRTGADGSEAAYRRAIELDPKRADAMNNLANSLLQSRDLDGALTLAQKAVSVAPSPSNLDTLGQVYKAKAQKLASAGDQQAAASQLKLAADVYRRLAAAVPQESGPIGEAATCLDLAGDYAGAAICYDRRLQIPSLNPIETAKTKNNLAMCLLRLNRGRDDLARAGRLIDEGIRAAGDTKEAAPLVASFQDTRGWIALAAGSREGAIAAFREALQKWPTGQNNDSPRLGLATALAGGSAAEQQEAAGLLDAVKASQLGPEDAKRYERARGLLAPGGR